MLSTPELADDLKGRVIAPDDPDYDEARTVFMGGFDRRPAVIVRAADANDVARAIAHAREAGLEIAVRSGGHSPAAHSVTDGGLVIDLSEMRAIEIDPDSRTAWAEAGITAGDYTVAAHEHGLATGFGDAYSVGVGGITLAGGAGFLSRKHGLTIDSLLAAEIVTADGELLRAEEEHHPDLFWAIRGGGGNVGVATRFLFRLHEVGTIYGGELILPATPEVIAGVVAEAQGAPDELSTIAAVMTAPPMPFIPPEYHGKPIVMATLAYAGPAEDGEQVVAPFRALADPITDMVGPKPYPELLAQPPEGYHPVSEARTMLLDGIDVEAAEAIIERLEASTATMAVTQLRILGGAVARVPADATAFAHRDAPMIVNVAAVMADASERDQHAAWVAGLANVLSDGNSGAYVGFLGDEGPDRVRAAYPAKTWERLAEVKAKYDPDNVFRLNQNVPPASG